MKKRSIIIVGCLVLWALLNNSITYGQEKTIRVLEIEDYGKILDMLFPRDVFDEYEYKRSFVLVLRYKPSFDAETQIVIAGRENGINVVEFTSLDGNVYYKLGEIMEKTGQKSSVELAKYIRVKKRELKIPLRQLNIWRRNLIDSVSRSVRPKVLESTLPAATMANVTDDGTRYELWDSSLSGEIYFTPSGIEENGRDFSGKRSLIRWMERVRREVDKRK